MARYSKTLTPAAQAAFLAALEGGALVEAAAAAVGVAISTLYWRRHRDPVFAEGWAEAVEKSSGAVWRPLRHRSGQALPGRRLRLGKRRRVRFCAMRREIFLSHLALTCNTAEAADAAGVHVSTVYRRIRRDPRFAGAVTAALARGYKRLGRLHAQEREAAAARLREDIVPAGEMVRDFDRALKLMRRWERPDGSIGPRFVAYGRMKRWTFEEAMAALDRTLRALGLDDPETPDNSRAGAGLALPGASG